MNNNNKRILCYNYVKGNKINPCSYGTKCMYAHNLSEQKVDSIRSKAYSILNCDSDLSKINLIKDKRLFNTFTQLTKICYNCSKNNCHGGYNCRNGSISQIYKICNDDLLYGNCRRIKCNGIHLTSRGLVPYYTQIKNNMVNNKQNITNTKADIICREVLKYKRPLYQPQQFNNMHSVENLLLKSYNHINKDSCSSNCSSEEDSETINNMRRELDNNSHDSFEDCIFH